MVKFLKYISVFVLALVLFKVFQFTLVFTDLNSKDSANFYGSESTSKRIILVGSSNLDFNYDYALLQNTFKEYAIVGCNLNEPSGLYATVHKLKKLNPKEDDIVIFCLPHSLYEPDKLIPLGSKGKKGFSSALIKSVASDFPIDFFEAVLNIKSTDTFKLLNEKSKDELDSNAFKFTFETEADELEDYLECKKLDGAFHIQSTGFDEDYMIKMLAYLQNSFESKIWFRFPVVKKAEYLINQKRLDYLEANYPFINKFDNSIFDDEYWYNQWYHLNSCGRELNTSKLMDELTRELN